MTVKNNIYEHTDESFPYETYQISVKDFIKALKENHLYGRFLIAVSDAFYYHYSNKPLDEVHSYLNSIFKHNNIEQLTDSIKKWSAVRSKYNKTQPIMI